MEVGVHRGAHFQLVRPGEVQVKQDCHHGEVRLEIFGMNAPRCAPDWDSVGLQSRELLR
jgi:hypothetical protein